LTSYSEKKIIIKFFKSQNCTLYNEGRLIIKDLSYIAMRVEKY